MDQPTPSRRLFRSRLLPFLLGYHERQGGQAQRIRDAYDLPPAGADAADLTVSLASFRDLTAELAADLDDPFFGLSAAASLVRGGFGIVEFLLETAGTIQDALAQFARYDRLASNLLQHRIERGPGRVLFKQWVPGDVAGLGRHGNEFALAVLVQGGRNLLSSPVAPRRVWLAHPAPADRGRILEFFGVEDITFGAGWNGMVLDAELAARRLPKADEALNSALSAQLAHAASESGDFVELVCQRTEQTLASGPPTIERVAKLLHMSDRTLQRRLRQEGSSFREMVARVRRQRGEALLRNEDLSLGEVAFLLGYTDLSAFVRAFKQWTGLTPGAFRRGSASETTHRSEAKAGKKA